MPNLDGLGETLPEIAVAAGSDSGVSDIRYLERFLTGLIGAVADRRLLDQAELDECAESGAAAAAAGAAPRAVVDLYSSAAWRLWRDGADLAPWRDRDDPSVVRDAALWMLRGVDDGVAALIEGFQLARIRIVRQQEAARNAVIDGLISGGREASVAASRADAIGIALAGPIALLVAEFDDTAPEQLTELPTVIEAALNGRQADAQPIAEIRDSRLVLLCSAKDEAAVTEVADRVGQALDDLVGARRWRAAVSTPRLGPMSVAVSFAETREALDLSVRLIAAGPTLNPGDRVVRAADIAVYRVLLRDRDAAWQLVTSTLGGLTAARDGGRELLATLAAYLRCGGNSTATGKALHLSVRAVTYRLERVATLTGRNPTDLAERLTLHAAVVTAELLGWPDAQP